MVLVSIVNLHSPIIVLIAGVISRVADFDSHEIMDTSHGLDEGLISFIFSSETGKVISVPSLYLGLFESI